MGVAWFPRPELRIDPPGSTPSRRSSDLITRPPVAAHFGYLARLSPGISALFFLPAVITQFSSVQFPQPLTLHQHALTLVSASQHHPLKQKIRGIMKGPLRNSELRSHPEEERFRLQEFRWLGHWPVTSTQFDSSDELLPSNLFAPRRDSPTVKVIKCFPISSIGPLKPSFNHKPPRRTRYNPRVVLWAHRNRFACNLIYAN